MTDMSQVSDSLTLSELENIVYLFAVEIQYYDDTVWLKIYDMFDKDGVRRVFVDDSLTGAIWQAKRYIDDIPFTIEASQ